MASVRAVPSLASRSYGLATLTLRRSGLATLTLRRSGRGRTVVLVHGLGADSSAWRLVVPQLAAGYRVVAVDLLGCGKSPKPRRITLTSQAAALAKLLRRLRRATVVAHSYGGAVALLAAAQLGRRQQHLAQLVLISPAAFPHRLPRTVQLAGSPLGLALEQRLSPQLQATALLRMCFHSQLKVTAEALAAYARALGQQRASLAAVAAGLWQQDDAALSLRYRRVSVPTLMVWGKNDRVVPPSHAARLKRLLPRAELATIRACGHNPHDEQPAALVATLQRFLRRVS